MFRGSYFSDVLFDLSYGVSCSFYFDLLDLSEFIDTVAQI